MKRYWGEVAFIAGVVFCALMVTALLAGMGVFDGK